jgi:hypothetical protein
MIMRVVSIREAARRKPAGSLSADVTFLERERTPAWYKQYKRSETRHSCMLRGHVSTKVTQSLADIMHGIEDTEQSLLNKVQSYSKGLPDFQRLTTDAYR